jgi:hypothetical protein
LTLHCGRREKGSNSLAICLIEGEEGLEWARVSDSLLSSSYSENRETIDSYGFERRQIIIKAEPAKYEATPRFLASFPFIIDPFSFLLDVRSVMKHGYSIRARTDDRQSLDFGKDGKSIVRFESFDPICHVFLDCTNPEDDFRFVISGFCRIHTAACESRELRFNIRLVGNEDNSLHKHRARLPSGKVAEIVLKRKVESGKPIYVVQILIGRA